MMTNWLSFDDICLELEKHFDDIDKIRLCSVSKCMTRLKNIFSYDDFIDLNKISNLSIKDRFTNILFPLNMDISQLPKNMKKIEIHMNGTSFDDVQKISKNMFDINHPINKNIQISLVLEGNFMNYESFPEFPKNLISLRLDFRAYLCKVIIPDSVIHLIFGDHFNRIVTIPNSVTHLTFGFHFNQIVKIPDSVIYLKFGFLFGQSVTIPISVTHLTFGYAFNQIVTIPNSVTHLTFGVAFNQIVTIPNSVTHLAFGYSFNQPITIPDSVTHLVFGDAFNQIVTIPNSVTHLAFGYSFNQSITIPDSVTHLVFGNIFDKIITIPDSVVELKLGIYYNQPITISKTVILTFGTHNQSSLLSTINGKIIFK